MSRRILVGLFALMLAHPASAQYIGIFLDPNATTCAATVGGSPWIDLHVVAVLEGRVTEMTGAQFKIIGAPSGWTVNNALWVPDIGATLGLGHPLFAGPRLSAGANVVFGRCNSASTQSRVPLGRLVILGAPTPDDVHLRVVAFRSSPYSDPDCPFVTDCTPMYSKVCVGGGEIVLNGDDTPSSCQLAIATQTWSGVKQLFR